MRIILSLILFLAASSLTLVAAELNSTELKCLDDFKLKITNIITHKRSIIDKESNNEDIFHCLVSGAYLAAKNEKKHLIFSEVKAGRGFADNIFYPKDNDGIAIIHEYKYANRNEDHNAKLESGFLQIYEKNYMQYIVDKTQKDGKANKIINRSIVFYEDDSKEIKVEAKQTEHEIKVAKDIVEFFNKHPSVLCLIEGKPKDFLEKIKYNSLDNWLKTINDNNSTLLTYVKEYKQHLFKEEEFGAQLKTLRELKAQKQELIRQEVRKIGSKAYNSGIKNKKEAEKNNISWKEKVDYYQEAANYFNEAYQLNFNDYERQTHKELSPKALYDKCLKSINYCKHEILKIYNDGFSNKRLAERAKAWEDKIKHYQYAYNDFYESHQLQYNDYKEGYSPKILYIQCQLNIQGFQEIISAHKEKKWETKISLYKMSSNYFIKALNNKEVDFCNKKIAEFEKKINDRR